MQHVLKVHLYNSVCASVPSQYAGIEALNDCRNIPAEINVEYMKSRDFVYERLTKMGLDAVKPNGAFYIFPSIEKYGLDSHTFATKLLRRVELLPFREVLSPNMEKVSPYLLHICNACP